ncbi:MAG: PH domain-containing protein [Candidatus Micrarchaeota archaeon]|nr:PH domain-containing protein [Candidatus Micrarchaeota archaeon]
MAVNDEDVKAAKSILWPDEKVEVTVRQRRIGPGGSATAPTSVLATDKRIIILNRATLGIRQDYEAIPYRQITSVRLEHGMISSSVFVRVMGYDRDQGLLKNGKEEGEIDGLSNSDAKTLADYLNRKLEDAEQEPESSNADAGSEVAVYCSKCGAKNQPGSKYCSRCGAPLGN